jgi:hypothetical protein
MMTNDNTKSVIVLSAESIKDTFCEMSLSAKLIKADIQSILETLKVIDDTLSIFTNSASLGTQLREINPFALLPTTVKLATKVVSDYVTKRTGISFVDWAKFVDSILEQFGDYTEQLDKVSELSEKYNKPLLSVKESDKQEIESDEALLVNVKSKTLIWTSYIEKIAKLVLVIDAVLDARHDTIKQTIDTRESNIDVNDDIKKMLGAVTDKIDIASQNKAKEFLLNIFSSFDELKSKTKNFSDQTKDLLPKISDLENFLDLGIAQIQVCTGKISLQEVEILEARVAAIITIPRLTSKLFDLHQDVLTYNKVLEKLNVTHQNQEVEDSIYTLLMSEYTNKLNMLTVSLNQAEEEVKIWQTEGVSCLEDGISWIRRELEITRIRKLVGQLGIEELQQRSKSLNQELRRMEQARKILSTLK